MDKKDIYEHLANIYLDASSKRKKKNKKYQKYFGKIFFLSVSLVFILAGFLIIRATGSRKHSSEIALVLEPSAVKINFHFDPARKETYTIDLKNLDLSRYQVVAFSAKKVNQKDNISLRVEFSNAFKEKSETYVRNIPAEWQEYKIKFSDFKNINDWSNMTKLFFMIEEWNAKEKRDVVYIDNVRLLR